MTPLDNLVRAVLTPDAAELRAAGNGGDGRTLLGHFAVFNRWTEIDSFFEGRFLERITPGAFTGVFADARNVKVLYDHGHDPSIGNKPLGTIVDLREDDIGAYYEVDLIDTSYNVDLLAAVDAGLLGASFRFSVGAEEWVDEPAKTKRNPDRIPERTITEISRLYEFGPVTFPAYTNGTKVDARGGNQAMTDQVIDRLLTDPLAAARFAARAGLPNTERIFDAARDQRPPTNPDTPPPERSDPDTAPPAGSYQPTPRPRRSLDDQMRRRIEALRS